MRRKNFISLCKNTHFFLLSKHLIKNQDNTLILRLLFFCKKMKNFTYFCKGFQKEISL